MKLNKMNVFDPYEKREVNFEKIVEDWITDPKAGYIRV